MKLDEKYTYDDIQIVPDYSEIKSRSLIETKTELFGEEFKLPIMSSPMDTVTEYEMANALYSMGGIGVLHRFMSPIELKEQLEKTVGSVIISIGSNNMDDTRQRIKTGLFFNQKWFLIDVAHGHSDHVKGTLKSLKDNYGNKIKIIAGSIATVEAARDLIDWGADALRIGIGNGCFTPNMIVVMADGSLKKISDIKIGDFVITHTGEAKKVIDTIQFNRDEEIMIINGIECTNNHEFYVVNKKYENIVTDENVHNYAEWIAAENLTDDFLLIEY